MQRLLVLAAIAAAAILMFPAMGNSQSQQTPQSTPSRAVPDAVTASTTPKRDRSRPYSFTTTGKVTPPPRYCAAGQNPPAPGQSGQNCVPVLCPPGRNDKNPYCFTPGPETVCAGTVTVRFQRRSSTISSRNVQLRPDCTFTSRVTFGTKSRLRQGTFTIRVRFQGNSVMVPRSSGTHTVRAG